MLTLELTPIVMVQISFRRSLGEVWDRVERS